MADFMKGILDEELDKESGAGLDVFPKGTWEGVIEVTRIQVINREDLAEFFLKNWDGIFFAEQSDDFERTPSIARSIRVSVDLPFLGLPLIARSFI